MAARAIFPSALLIALTSNPSNAWADSPTSRYRLEVGSELRTFFQRAADPRQTDASVSVSLAGRADYAWGSDLQWVFAPFVRYDSADSRRSHADLRECELRYRHGAFDWRVGLGKVFWGTVESVHLVDIVNQTDGVESIDGEDKLGQPMLGVTWSAGANVLSALVLPGFRERTLSGAAGRLRGPVPYRHGSATYESSRGRGHIDTALRWAYSAHGVDIGLARFDGTSREPHFQVLAAAGEPVLQPIYDQIHQSSVDVNAVWGSWIVKLEALHSRSRGTNHSAAVGGFEYTLPNKNMGAAEFGLLAELALDSRGRNSPSLAQRDLFLGLRISGNDVAGSQLLAGVLQDLQGGGRFVSVDASRRLGESGTVSLQLRLFAATSAGDPLAAVAADDHLRLEYVYHL